MHLVLHICKGGRLKSSIALRTAVADLYNHTYRQGKASQYTAENVCIVPGGRAGLSRVAAVIGDVYTASLCVVRDPRRVLMAYFYSLIRFQTILLMIKS